MNKNNKYSSSIKVGFLTLSAISILIFTILWVKGRSLSSGERIDLAFNDINGMRAGSAVQMMGLRIGQVENITPVIQGKDSYVKLRFVVTEKGVKIPYASTISIQQSGIIGEQFLEVTPPKTTLIYSETYRAKTSFKKDDPIYMELSKGEIEVGKIVDVEVVKKSQVPPELKEKIQTQYALKLSYTVNLAGLIVDNNNIKVTYKNGKIFFNTINGEIIETPKKDLKYTVIEPMRLSDFMDLGFRATNAMLETNDKINEVLSDEFIGDIKNSVANINLLTKNANNTLDKATVLIDSSKKELIELTNQSQDLIASLTNLSNNLNKLVSDESLKNDLVTSIKSVGKMSENINRILEDEQSEEIVANLNETMRNLADISTYISEYAQDEKLKSDITCTISNLSSITTNIAQVMDDYNNLEDKEKLKLKSTVKDVTEITKNLKKFSEKLNKRFLLFRLMF